MEKKICVEKFHETFIHGFFCQIIPTFFPPNSQNFLCAFGAKLRFFFWDPRFMIFSPNNSPTIFFSPQNYCPENYPTPCYKKYAYFAVPHSTHIPFIHSSQRAFFLLRMLNALISIERFASKVSRFPFFFHAFFPLLLLTQNKTPSKFAALLPSPLDLAI